MCVSERLQEGCITGGVVGMCQGVKLGCVHSGVCERVNYMCKWLEGWEVTYRRQRTGGDPPVPIDANERDYCCHGCHHRTPPVA